MEMSSVIEDWAHLPVFTCLLGNIHWGELGRWARTSWQVEAVQLERRPAFVGRGSKREGSFRWASGLETMGRAVNWVTMTIVCPLLTLSSLHHLHLTHPFVTTPSAHHRLPPGHPRISRDYRRTLCSRPFLTTCPNQNPSSTGHIFSPRLFRVLREG